MSRPISQTFLLISPVYIQDAQIPLVFVTIYTIFYALIKFERLLGQKIWDIFCPI